MSEMNRRNNAILRTSYLSRIFMNENICPDCLLRPPEKNIQFFVGQFLSDEERYEKYQARKPIHKSVRTYQFGLCNTCQTQLNKMNYFRRMKIGTLFGILTFQCIVALFYFNATILEFLFTCEMIVFGFITKIHFFNEDQDYEYKTHIMKKILPNLDTAYPGIIIDVYGFNPVEGQYFLSYDKWTLLRER